MAEQIYKYVWGNNEKRKKLKGRICRVIHRAGMNSNLIEFIDNGELENCNRNALRKVENKDG